MSAPVSLCLIVKNEERNLPACLGSVAGLCGEIVVVDTGSTDRTRAVAAELGARVFDFPWVDSFAAARNESIRRASLPWIFWLDADDRLDDVNRRRLRDLLAHLPDDNAAFLMQQRSLPADGSGPGIGVDHFRLFRNHPALRWDYRVHEQIAPAILRSGASLRRTDIAIDHTGYQDPALRRRKEERNLRLLQMQDADRPDDPATLFHLGWTLQALDRHAEALPVLRRSLQRVPPHETTVRKLHALLARSHRRLGQPEAALTCIAEGLARFPDDPELLFLGGTLRFLTGDLAAAESLLLRLQRAHPEPHVAIGLDPGWQGFKGRYNLGVVYHAQGRPAEAEAQFRAALAEQPGHGDTWLALADLLLGQGRQREVEEAVAGLEADPARRAEAALVRSRLHLARSEFDAARQLLQRALEGSPQALPLRQSLSHVLLRENRDPAAAERALLAVLELEAGNDQARDNLALLRRRQSGVASAPRESPKAAPRENPPRSARAAEEQFQRAEQAFNDGRDDEAAALYRALLEANVTPGVMLCRLGMLADRRGDLDAAWELLCRAVAADPHLPSRITRPSCAHHQLLLRREYALEEVAACPVCGATDWQPLRVVNLLFWKVYHPALHPIRRWLGCRQCEHAFTAPRPAAAALRDIQNDDPPAAPVTWSYQELLAADEIVRRLRQRRPGGDWLAVGGEGALAAVAQDYDYRVCALDGLAELDLGRQFDVVTLANVLEYCPQPGSVLAGVRAMLRPGGLLWLSTPDRTGVWARLQGEQDGTWHEGQRLHYFSRRSLSRLLADQGFAVADLRLSPRYQGAVETTCARDAAEG